MIPDLCNVFSSQRLLEILNNACEGVEREELQKILKVSNSRLSQLLKKTSELKLIENEGSKVITSPKGMFVLRVMEILNSYSRFLDAFGDYMGLYILDDLPDWLITRFHELADIQVVERQEDVFSPHQEFLESLSNSREIYGYTTVFFKEYVDFFLRLADEGRKIEVIVNEDVFRRIAEEFADELRERIERENVRFYVSRRDFRFSFVVTDNFFTISFYLKNGFFDYRRDFVCRSEDARRWGRDLFKYVKENSDRIINTEELKGLIRNQ